MDKKEALERAASAPSPVRELLEELIERSFGNDKSEKSGGKKKATSK